MEKEEFVEQAKKVGLSQTQIEETTAFNEQLAQKSGLKIPYTDLDLEPPPRNYP